MNTENYFKNLKNQVDGVYDVINEARAKGFDPVDKVEIPLAMSMAEKVVGLISVVYPQVVGCGIDDRILELEKEYGKLDVTVVFKIGEEVAKQKFCKFNSVLEAIDAGIRIGFAYQTIAVVASPIEGFTGLDLGKTRDGKEYFIANFSGPIRSAGTTASVICLMLIDYLRELFGYARYDPTEEEVERVWVELEHFHDRITNLQYMPLEKEALFLAKNMPIQVSGDPSEKIEVPRCKNLPRVNTDFLRSGFCLVMAEALAQKAAKGFRLYNGAKKNGVKMTGFDWIDKYLELHEELTSKGKAKKGSGVPVYIKDLVAGRPVFGHPSRSGSFRFRYGRGRVSGFSAASLHPATMAITDNFIATGTQLKIEKPTKGCVVTACDVIEGPIVKLFNGSVRKLKTKEEARKLYKDVEEIIYLGDILFPFSDVANRNYDLVKPGYVEEWWSLDLREKGFEEDINYFNVSFEDAVEFSRKYGVAFYPKFIFYWREILKKDFLELLNWLKYSQINEKLVLPFNKTEQTKFELGKRALEILGVEHEVTIEDVVLNEENSKILLVNLGLNFDLKKRFLKDEVEGLINKLENDFSDEESVLKIVDSFCEFEIKDKSGDFIGTRMGRPEKAKLRKLTGSPNVLFPIGSEGGRLRSVQAACEVGFVKSTFPINYCKSCDKETIYRVCEDCGAKTEKRYYCFECKAKLSEKCKEHERSHSYCNQSLDMKHYFKKAAEKAGMTREDIPALIKGVRGTSSEEHDMENLAKGFLRAKHNLQVNKDGTIRFDVTELPLVAFKPSEVGVSVEKLKELGYVEDIYGKELVNDKQVLELMPHDILLPSCDETLDEKADDVFVNVCGFVDDLLVNFYGLKSFYNVKNRDDLVGQLGVFMAPHNCAGVICRFIGFSNTLGAFASPYMHAAVRRDCDGDEAAIMLLGDTLLNFSRKFLPSHRGGTQDAPLVLNVKIDAGEVDDQILDLEMCMEYPIELYRNAEQRMHSSSVKNIPIVKSILREGKNPFLNIGFTHDTADFNEGVACSSYKSLATMQDKVQHQMELVERIRAVDTAATARLMIERHFLRDLKGNLRKFSMQTFRCVVCNEIMRRPPLTGVCVKCKGKIIFTINEGGIKKYLEPALNLARKYNLSHYLKQNIELTKRYIDSIFGKELEKQTGLGEWF